MVSKRIAIVAGKGGVGKSIISLSLAHYVPASALLDLDLTMPSIPISIKGDVVLKDGWIYPVTKDGIEFFSLGYFGDDPLTWDSKRIKELIRTIFKSVKWSNHDYLFIDCPPGTDAVFQSVIPYLDVAIIVTTPSAASYTDAKRVIELLRDSGVPIAGEIRNMSYFKCDECGHIYYFFNSIKHDFMLDIPLILEIPLLELKEELIPQKYLPVEKVLNAIRNPQVDKRKENRERKRRIMKEVLGIG